MRNSAFCCLSPSVSVISVDRDVKVSLKGMKHIYYEKSNLFFKSKISLILLALTCSILNVTAQLVDSLGAGTNAEHPCSFTPKRF
jgi:hypothetical protein